MYIKYRHYPGMSSIEEIKRIYPETSHVSRRTKKVRTDPEFYICTYLVNNTAIAEYDSRINLFMVSTKCIGRKVNTSAYERSINSKYGKEYEFLFNMYGIDENTPLSEYVS